MALTDPGGGRYLDVERGIWQPPSAAQSPPPEGDPTFHTFAARWLRGREADGLRPRTIEDYRWALEQHLLPFFAELKLSEIDVDAVERYKESKVAESERRRSAIERGRPVRDDEGRVLRPLAPNAVNKTLDRLAQILDLAVDLELVDRNSAKGKRRRLKCTEPRRSHVEVEQLPALVDAADAYIRPIIATMAGRGSGSARPPRSTGATSTLGPAR